MNRNLWLLAVCQGLFLTNNVTFIAINGLVGLSPAEEAAALACGFSPVTLGPRVLRAETAPLACLALLTLA